MIRKRRTRAPWRYSVHHTDGFFTRIYKRTARWWWQRKPNV